MSSSAAATTDRVVVQPDEDQAFWDLVCAEDDWLQTEFDAIVANNDEMAIGAAQALADFRQVAVPLDRVGHHALTGLA